MVITSSLLAAASLGDGLICPPNSASSASTALFRSNRFSWCPALIRLRAMGAPMLPRPMNAIRMTSP
ncbi:hypothetical protein D3C80_2036720 [compost metagenome]